MRLVQNLGLKILAVAALAAAINAVAPPVTATAGRDFSRCMQSCNDSRRACTDRCAVDCRDMFPNSSQQRSACIEACKGICDSEWADCKLVCQAIKEDQSPDEP